MKNFFRNSAIALLLLGSLGVLPAGAQLAPLGPETVVVSGTSLGVQCPQVIGHADRSFTVVWQQTPVESASSLVAQRFNGAGSPVGGPIDVDAGTLVGRVPFDIAVENRGALGDIVTWTSVPEGSSNPSQRFDSRVLSAAAPTRIGAPSYVSQLFPRRTGGYLAAWPTARGESCSFALLNAAGRLASPTRRIDGTGSSGRHCLESAAQALDGSFALDWFTISRATKVPLQRFGADARPLNAPVEAVEDGNAAGVLLASAPDGRTAMTWVNYGSDPSGLTGTIRVRFFTAAGVPTGPALNVATPPDPPVNGFNPDAIGMDRLGRALLVWNLLDLDDPFVEAYTVQLWGPGGAASPPLSLGADPVRVGVPFCASVAAAGRTWVVAWRSMVPETGAETIFVRRFIS
jgi:hypothetical protein